MRRLYGGLGLLALLLALVAAGCGSSNKHNNGGSSGSNSNGNNVTLTQGSGLTFAMVTHSDEGSFWSVVKKGAEAAAKAEGVKLIWSPSNNDPQKQAQLIDAAVSQKVDGLAVSVPNADAIRGSLQKAKAAGIPIVTLNSGEQDFKALGAITHVAQDETVAGRAAGERFKSLGAKKVLCIVHEQGNIALQQRCHTVPLMSIWRNFFLGSEPTKGAGPLKRVDVRFAQETMVGEMRKMGIDVRDPDQPVGTLSGGERQAVSIARAVYFGAKVLILDEPTSALGVKQSGVVLRYVAQARDRGLGVIFITHNPNHAYPVGDRFVILNRGRLMGSWRKSEISREDLIRNMSGGAELEALEHELQRVLDGGGAAA